jgi:hypothetical protein
MGIFVAGRDLTPGAQTHVRGLFPGNDYIFQYKVSPYVFAFISKQQMSNLVDSWVRLRTNLDERNSNEVLTINGVSVNTGTGDIFVRGSVAGVPVNSGQGVNPYAVAAIIASVFANIQIGVSLLYVYEVGTSNGPTK